MARVPSPAIAIVGRHNSGKTTLVEKLISTLVDRGLDVGSVKHHSHAGFEIDIPGKDSYRHRAAGASETVIAAPGQMARIQTIEGEIECSQIVQSMPGHDIVIVEGYRKSGLPTIEVMRSGNESDAKVAALFVEGARCGWPLGTDFTQFAHGEIPVVGDPRIPTTAPVTSMPADAPYADIASKLPTANTVALVTDIPEAHTAALLYGIPSFDINDSTQVAAFLEENYARPRVTVVIQAGGESRRMGTSKATVPFAGRPLICRMVERLAPVADELVITTNEPQNLEFLSEEFPQHNIRLARDEFNFRGALPGLYTALLVAKNPYVAIVACDMVFASSSLIVAEAIAMNETGSDLVVPSNRHGYEPFHAVYRRATCLPAVRSAIDRGEKRAQSFFKDIKVCDFPQERVLQVEPMGGCFVNANTPDELRSLEESFLEN